MNYLLDTCVLSEFTRRRPSEKVIRWIDSVAEGRLFISVVTVGEIQRGIDRLPESHRKMDLLSWLNDAMLKRFEQRILPLDAPTLLLWGSFTAQMGCAGHPIGMMDSLITATALQNHLIIVTRNTTDFVPCGVQVINPWE